MDGIVLHKCIQVALGELILDPYYRTLNGFAVLIEKEWCSFGHQFALREGHSKGMENYANGQRAPIFLQFIDAVYQLTILFPNAFEFNQYFLVLILDHLHSCMFGTFLSNSMEERYEKLECNVKTHSLWDLVKVNIKMFVNQDYEVHQILEFDVSKIQLRLWRAYYLRWQDFVYPSITSQSELDLQVLTLSLYYEDMEPTRGFTIRKKKKTLMRRSRRRHLKSSHATNTKKTQSETQVMKIHKRSKLRESDENIS